jgi:hypothetical protein
MPTYRIRAWAEQTLFDCNDYEVEADTLEEACELIQLLQTMADEYSDKDIVHPHVARMDHQGFHPDVVPLDPEEIISGDTGYTLIDGKGQRARDLVSVPTGCAQLGEPLDI